MSLLTANVKILGTRPLLYHCFTPDALSIDRKERTGVAGNDPEEWKRTYTATDEGQLFLDRSYIFGCLREAARHTKKGRGSIQSSLTATLQVISERVLTNRHLPTDLNEIHTYPSQPVYLDVRSVRNPATKGRNVRYRLALSPPWECNFTILWDNTIVSRNQMEAVCRDAGILVGLADGRSIGFGRFDLVEFEVEE